MSDLPPLYNTLQNELSMLAYYSQWLPPQTFIAVAKTAVRQRAQQNVWDDEMT